MDRFQNVNWQDQAQEIVPGVPKWEMERLMLQMMAAQTDLLQQIRDELVTMNEAQEVTDNFAEPDMFATMNGPRATP